MIVTPTTEEFNLYRQISIFAPDLRLQTAATVRVDKHTFRCPADSVLNGADLGWFSLWNRRCAEGLIVSTHEDFMTDNAAVTAITSLDLNRYLGKWYELCRRPIKYEDETATDITARYSLNESGTVRVDNRCFDKDDKPKRAIGEATPVDGGKSRLKVTFLPRFVRWIPFTSGDYWVLKIDPGYQVALVGSPDRKYLWLLARDPDLAQGVRDEYLAEAKRQGFDLTKLIVPRHTGRDVADDMITN